MNKQKKFNQQNSKLILEELEERRLFSGGIEGLIVSDLDSEAQAIYADLDTSKAQTDSTRDQTSASAAEEQTQEIVFVDEGVDNHQQLVDDLRNNADSSRNIEVVVLDRDQDGIEQISAVLQDRDDLDAVHIISHGSDGSIELGNNSLNANTLEDNNLKIALWANAFDEAGDILIYGCNLAETTAGQSLINDISSLTLTDVAASTDLTGHVNLGGDWALEFNAGSVEAEIAISDTGQDQWSAVLTTTADDDFSYPVGALGGNGGGAGWASTWGGGSDLQVVASSLTHPVGGLETAGGAVELNAGAILDTFGSRDLATSYGSADETIWVSFLLQPDATTGSGDHMGLVFGTGGYFNTNQLYVGYEGSNFRINGWGGTGDEIVVPGAVSGETAFIVLKLDISASGNETASMYVNPTAGVVTPDTVPSATKTDLDLGIFDTITIAGGREGATNASLLDQIRIGSSFADVAPAGDNTGTAIWRDASTTPQASDWDGNTFTATTATAPAGDYRIMQGAEAPTRDEIIIIGVDESSEINGEIWNGSSWSVLPSGTLGSPLGTVSQNYWWSMDVAYEQQSGDAVMVWADGTDLKSSVWDGSNWTVPTVVNDFGGTTPRQIQLASQPSGDEMVMVVSDSSGNDTAWVWDGSSWTSQRSLDTSGGNLTSVYVSYEQQSGDALVTYAKSGDANVYYQIWNGTSWSAEASVAPPGGVTSSANWVTLGSDPGSDRIVMGVVTSGGTAADIWLSVWNGSSWEASLQAETSATGSVYPNVAVAFESTSGQAIAVYGENGSNTVKYRTWDSGSGWSTEQIGPDIGGEPNSLMLAADPISDQIMLSAQDANSDVNYVLWDGAAWGATTELATATTEVKNQPFLFLWDQALVNDAPVAVDDTVAIDENTADTTTVTTVSATGATEGQYAEMYWADKVDNAIYKANADGTGGTTTVLSGLNAPVGVEVDYNGGKLYWTTNVAGDASVIQSANLDGTGLTTLVTGLTDPDSIALDLTNGKMYWTDDTSGEIRRANLDGSAVEIVLSGLTNPESVALDVDSGKMYWTDHGDLKIQRANLDGTGVEDLVTTGLSNVGDVELDLDNGKMYWIDGAIGKIQCANLDGTGVEDLVTSGLGDAYYLALDVSAGKMYWTDDGDNIIQRANLDGTGIEDLITTGVDDPRDVALSAPATLSGPLSYSITSGNTGNAFTIDANTGEITVADSNVLDFETTPVFNLTVEVQDTVSLLTDTATITVSLNNINEIVNSVPGPQSTNEDTALVFSTANSNLVSINDPETGGGEIAVTLAVNDGTLTLSGTAGLTFVAGSDNSASMTFTGTLLDINAALDGLTFMPDPDYTGAVNLQVTSHDDTSLLGIYTFDDPASPGNDDSPGSLNDGVVNGATPVYDATRGDVLSFDGVDDGVQIYGLLGEPADVTLSAWINFTKTDPGEVISLGGSVLLRAGDWGASDGIRTSYYDGSWQNLDFSTPITGTGWRHVAFVFDDTNDMRRVYLDGVEVASAVTTTSIIHGVDADTFIGQHPTDPSNFFFEGMIDDARIYDRALTAAEITSNMSGVPTSDIDNVAITVNNLNDAPVMTAWFNDAWDTRKELSISAAQVAGDVTNFPVLITLNTDAGLAAQALANGDDIVFTAADGVTQLAHEIEFFDETTGELRVWVKADLSGSVDTSIYMYFGNAASGPQENIPGVWDNYVGVYHLSESPTGAPGELIDSSGSGNHATTEGAMDGADSVATTIGQGLAFDGTNDMIRIADSATLDSITDEATFSLWINFVDTADGDTQIIMASSNRYSDIDGYEWAQQGTGEHFFYPDAGLPDVNYKQGPNPFSDGTWHHLAATMDFATKEVNVYVDGTAVSFTYDGVTGNWTSLSDTDDLLFGGNPDRATRFFNGMMDEIRIADVARSQEWIQTEYNNQKTPGTFFSVGVNEDREDKLTDINEDDFTSAGDSVLSIITSSGADRITDDDTGAVEGIAVSGADNTNGQWQYDANADGTWLAFGSVTDSNAVLLDTGASIRFVPTADYNGPAGDLTFHAWDQTTGANGDTSVDVSTNGGSTAYSSATFDASLNVIPMNDSPVLGVIGNQSIDELATLSFTATATDIDLPADTLTFSLDAASLAAGMTIDANTGVFSWTPTEGQGGSAPSVTITVTDNGTGNLVDSETFTITVNDVNTAPVLGAIGNQSIDELATLSFTATATDADLPADTLTFSLDAASITAGMTIDANTGVFSWTPTEGQGGSTPSVTITVTDNGTGNLVDSETFTVTVNDVNTAPVLGAIGNQNIDELATLSFTATATDADLPADTLTFSLDAASITAGMTIDANTGVFAWTPTEGQGGSTPSVTITVTDNGSGNLIDSETFTVTVNDVNTAPVLGAIGNQSIDELATLSFTATATDADLPADTLTFSLDAASLAAGMTIDANTGAFSWTPTEGQGGSTPSVTITVTDNGTGNLVDSETFTVTVNDVNTAPVLGAIGNQSIDELATLSFTATATDADLPADTLTFSLDAASLAAGMTIDANTGAFSWTPTEGQGGSTPSVTITVTDNGTGNLVDSETFTVTVNDVNTAPILGAIGNQSIDELATLGFTATATDADLPADTLTFSLDAASLAAGMTIDANTGAFSWTPTEGQGGSTPSVTITVTDNGTGNLVDSETFTVTVNDVNTAPVLGAIGNQSIDELATLSFTATATDADLPADTLTFSLDAASLAAGMTIDANTGVFAWTPTEGQGGSTPSVTITVTDNGSGNLVDSETFTITVNDVNTVPVLGAIGNQSIDELATLSFTATATDSDLPADTLTFSLDAASITAGMTIDANTGVFSWTPTEGQGGSTPSVTITVTDNGTGNLIDSETFIITVNDVNTAPVLGAIGNQSIDELATLSFTATATDADLPADTLTFSLDAASLAAGMTIDANTGVFAWTPTEGQGGSVPSVTITVTDNGTGNLIDNETFTVTVNDVNTAPVLGAIGNQSINELATLSFTATATDSDLPTDTLTFSLDAASITAGMTIDANTGVFSWTPAIGLGGTAPPVTITVTDNGTGNLIDSETFIITVNDINTTPVLGAIGNQSINELATLSFTATATDSDLPADTLTFSLDAASITAGMTIDANTGVFSWTPTEGQGGSVPSVTITVTDNGTGNLVDSETFTVTVNDVNTAPVLGAIGNQSIDELATLSFTATATDSDLPADTLTFSLDAASITAGMTIDANTGVFSWTPTEGQGGSTPSVTITVTDNGSGNLVDSETFTITVNDVNTAPVLGAIGNQSIDELATLSFTATATDADLPADTLTFSLDAASLAAGMTIDANTGVFAWTPTEGQGGSTPSVTITVTDNGSGNLVDSETFTITVNDVNTVPVLGAIGNQSIDELATLSFTATATDSDLPADTLTFSLDAASITAGMTIDANTGVFSWTPTEGQGGSVPSVTITVTDNGTGNLVDSETFTVTVNDVNTAPVLGAIGNQSIDELATLSFTATATDSDLPADTLTFSLDAASITAGMTIDANTGVFSWTPTEGQGGSTPSVTITVTDNGSGNLVDSETFTITVNDVNTAPVLGAIGNQSIDELATLSFTATATDSDLPADTLTFSLDAASITAGMTIDANTGAFSWTPTEGQGGSVPSVTITVTDNGTGNLIDSETFTVTVNDVNTAPVLGAIGNQSINELATLSFTATASDSDIPVDTLTFSLDAASLAAGMTIDANTGVFSWTPTEGQGGSVPSVTITVTDNGTGNLIDSETFIITVNDVNTAPVLGAIGNQSIDELATLSFTATATDADLPADTLTFSLDAASLAAGMTIDANTGVFAWTPTEGQGGSVPSVTITVTDNGTGNLIDNETFTVTVNDVNTAPVLGAIGNQSINELATLSFTATATDSDLPTDTLTFSLDAASITAGMTIDANTGVFSWTPAIGLGGTAPPVTITVTDNGTGNLIDSETFIITVNDINTAPVLGAIGNQSINELATLSFTATATDSDLPADTLTFSLDAASITAGMTIDANTGVFSWTPTEGQGGSTPLVTITVTDNGSGNLVDSETFTVTVNDVNTAPVLGAIGNQSINELATLSFTATATDADLPADTLTFSLDAASLAAGMTIDANTGVFSWTPTEGQGGSVPSVTITVTDNGTGNLIDSETFTVTVNDVNTAPVLGAIGNQSINELATLSFTATATDADLPADTLTFSLDAASLAAGMSIDANTGVFSWTPTEGQGGSTPSVTITVTDNGTGNLVDSETFTVTVNDVNTAPVLGAIGNQSIDELATLSFTATATDSDLPADTLTFSLDAASITAGMTIDANTGVFSWTPTEGQGGSTPSVTITVTDNGSGNLVDSETFNITVNDVNTAPVLGAIGNQSINELATLSFTATATDSDLPADTLTFSLDAASITAGMTIDANTGVFSWTPTEGQGGSTPLVTITVTDNGTGNLVDSETFTVTVNDVNTAPVLGAIGNQSINELATLSFTATATDADLPADTLTFSLDAASLAAGMTIDANTGVFNWTPTEGQGGSVPSVTITVTDNGTGNLIDSETFTVTVNDVNTAPVLGAIGNQSINELATLSFTATATDADLPADTLTFSLDAASLAAGMSIDANTGVFSWTPTEGQGGSTPSVTITVTDNGTGNLVDSETFTVTVNDVNTAPVLGAIGNQSIDELATLSFTATATDSDLPADTLTFSLDAASITAGMTIDANTGVFSWTPTEGQGGSTPSVTITVTDNGSGNLVDSETFNITVNDVNTAPVLGAIGNQSINELATLSFTATATDSDLPADTLTFSLDAASLAAGMTIDANTGVFAWTPTMGLGGTAPSVTITVTDNGTGNLVDSETFTVTVNDVNTAPVLGAIGNQSINELATLSFTATATDADLPADTLTFSLDAASLAAGMTIDANTGVFNWTPTEGQGGSVPSVTITVTDNGTGNLVDSETFTVTVNDVNTAPVLGAIGNQNIDELVTLSFTATATDADLPADTLTFSLDAASLAAGMTIDANTGAFSWTPTEGQGGSNPSVTITVTDNGTGNLVDSETFTVTVNEVNIAPTVANPLSDQLATEDSAFSFQFATNTFADLDGDTLTYTSDASGWLSFDAIKRTFSGTPLNSDVGSTLVTLTASDGNGGVISDTFNIVISNTNDTAVIAGTDTGAVSEDVDPDFDTLLETSGTLTITDPDVGESNFQVATINGTYGDLTIDAVGNWSYAADNTQAAIQQLDVLESLTDTLTVTAFDGTTHNVVITINGSEDTAVIGGVAVGTVTEDGALIASDTLSITDVDTNDNPISFNDVAPTLGINGYGTFEITANTWNYTLNNSHTAVQALGSGSALNDIFTFVASDGSTRVVTVTINGANDAPVIGGTSTGAVAEDVAVTAGNILDSGSLAIVDPDAGESGFIATTINGTYGDLTIDAAGNWSYSADNGQSTIQSLQAGESVSDTLTVTTADGSTHDVIITIIGARDAAPPPVDEPPDNEPPPNDEPPVDEQIDEVVEEQGGTGDDPKLEEIVRVAQDIRTPATEEDSSFAQPDEPESEPVNYGPEIEKQAPKIPEQPQPQALQAQNLSIDTLTLQVSDDEALNEQYELELLGRIDSMHLGMDDEAAQQNADDVNVQIVVGSTASLTVGIVSWVLRGGALLASFMSTVPLLNRFDPLPILKAREDEEEVEPDEDDDEKTQVREHARKVDNMFSGKGDSQQ